MNLKGSSFFWASIVLNVVLWGLVFFTFPKGTSSAILHYTAGVGIDFVGEGWQIITLPGIGAIIILGNVLLARGVKKYGQAGYISYWIFSASTLLIQCMLLATYMSLWQRT